MEIGRYFIEGMVGCYGVRPKCWVAAAVGAAVGLASTLIGAHESGKKEREARKKEAQSHARQQAYWNRKMNESYADTAAGQNMMRQAKDYADRNWKKAQGAAAVGGGTDAATAMAKESGNRMVGDTVAHMAAMDTARQDRAGAAMMQEDASYADKQAGHLRTQGANIANVASAMGNAAMSVGSSIESANASKGNADNAKAAEEAPAQNGNAASQSANGTAASRAVGGMGYDSSELTKPLVNENYNSTAALKRNMNNSLTGYNEVKERMEKKYGKKQPI